MGNDKNYRLTDDVAFFKRLARFRREASETSPDAFNEVARALFGMSKKEAQMLFSKYMHISNGAWACWSSKILLEEIMVLLGCGESCILPSTQALQTRSLAKDTFPISPTIWFPL